MAATRPETHAVSLSSFVSTPRLSRRSNSSLSLPFTAIGPQRGGIITGVTILSTSKWGLPSILPRPLKCYAMRDYHMQGYYNFTPPTKRYTTISVTKYLISSVSRDFWKITASINKPVNSTFRALLKIGFYTCTNLIWPTMTWDKWRLTSWLFMQCNYYSELDILKLQDEKTTTFVCF